MPSISRRDSFNLIGYSPQRQLLFYIYVIILQTLDLFSFLCYNIIAEVNYGNK